MLAETIARCRPMMFIEIGDYHRQQFADWLQRTAYGVCDKYERYPGLPNYLVRPA